MPYEESEQEAEGSGSGSTGHSVLQLYEAVRGCRNQQGQLLSEPFMHLPSRREYPDYYQQIKQPISLQQIRQAPGHSVGVNNKTHARGRGLDGLMMRLNNS